MRYILFLLGVGAMLLWSSCKKEAMGVDLELYELAKNTSGYTWYARSGAYLNKSSGSGHNYPKLRTRFNSVAATRLDANGKVQAGAQFPDGSIIVKELYDKNNTLERYAILYKDANNEFADAKGWVWGYINEDGKVAESAEKKGKSCIGCHEQSGNIDYVLMNKFFP